MSALLYYSMSSGLTADERVEIDKEIVKNRKKVCIFVRNVASNAKGKTKKVIVVSILVVALYFNNVPASSAIGLPMRPVPVVRVHKPSYDYRSKIKVAQAVSPKLDKITFIKYRELPVYIYMMDERFIKTVETRKLINKVRGGSLLEAAAALVLIVVMWQILGVGESFQIRLVHPRNGAVLGPANGGVYQQINHPKNSSKTSQIGTLDPNATLPDSPSNVLGLVDNFDVPVHEKSSMEGSILKGYNETKNIIFLNNVTNV